VTDKEAKALLAECFTVFHDPKWWDGGKPNVVKLNAAERDALRLARGVFGERCAVDHTRSPEVRKLSAQAARVERAPAGERVATLLSTPMWRGSEVSRLENGRVRLRHPSGAVAILWAEASS